MPMETLFPHLTSTGPAPSSREVMVTYRKVFDDHVAEGSMRPMVFPYHLYGWLLLVVYLLIPHTQNRYIYAARWPVLGIICWWEWKTIQDTTSMNMATGFAVGLINAWVVIWAFTWLVLNKPQWDAKRVQSRVVERRHRQLEHNGVANGSAMGNGAAVSISNGDKDIRKRTQAGRNAKSESNGHTAPNGEAKATSLGVPAAKEQEMEYYWQSYPKTFPERLSWVLDLLANFRMTGWNCAIPPLPAFPPHVKTALGEPIDAASRSGVSSIGLLGFETRQALFKSRVPRFIIGYFLLDIFKVIMKTDPYFTFGPNTYALPPHLQSLSPFLLRYYRQTISSLVIILSLEMVFYLAAFVFLLLGPNILGLRGEAWHYPTTWGRFSSILTKGLNGLWGSWWHQTFRFIFSAPTNYLIANSYISPRSAAAKISALLFAFGISGFLHAGGSISQFPKTHPSHAPIFFTLQALGILLQTTFCSVFHSQIKLLPRAVRKTANFLFTIAWLFMTGPWLTDDFARGGLWLYEPIPISPLRGLGFGDEGDGWWCWEHIGIGWYSGQRWWESGVWM